MRQDKKERENRREDTEHHVGVQVVYMGLDRTAGYAVASSNIALRRPAKESIRKRQFFYHSHVRTRMY